jgi:ribosomal protein S18 acetylase RimI-like enzyme
MHRLNVIAIREVQCNDEVSVWKIRNHPSVRNQSRQQADIPFAIHQKWFEKIINAKNSNFYIAEIYNETQLVIVGYCRYHKMETGFEVSIAVDPNYRGREIGTNLLDKTLTNFKVGTQISAAILKSNPASLHFFQKNNFRLMYSDEKCHYLIRNN